MNHAGYNVADIVEDFGCARSTVFWSVADLNKENYHKLGSDKIHNLLFE